MGEAVDLDENLVKAPTPARECPHPVDPFAADLGGEHRPDPVPPEPHGLMADVVAALGHEVLDVSQRQRVFHIHNTTSRMISGDELKYRNGLLGWVVRHRLCRWRPSSILL